VITKLYTDQGRRRGLASDRDLKPEEPPLD